MMPRLVIALGLAAALAACASDPAMRVGASSTLDNLLERVAARAVGARRPAEAARAPAPLTRAAIDAADRPLRIITLESRRATDAVAETHRSGGVRIHLTVRGLLFAFREGQLVATRGLGEDLMSADVPATATIRSARGTHRRIHDYLSGTDQTIRVALECTLASAGRETLDLVGLKLDTAVVVENCAAEGLDVENRYWFDQSGRLRQARQWISPTAGFLVAADPMR